MTFGHELRHSLHALGLEACVAYGESLVYNEDIGVKVAGNREAKPQLHTRRVHLHRRIEDVGEFGEPYNVVEATADLRLRHS